MGKSEKVIAAVLSGRSDHNVAFADLCHLLRQLGFTERVRGSHHIYSMAGVEEILNLQPKGSMSKAYQVRQVRGVIVKYRLGVDHGR